MIDVKKEVVQAIKNVSNYKVYYDFAFSRKDLPAITYREINNTDRLLGDRRNYSDIYMEIKIFTKNITELVSESIAVNAAMRELGFTRYFADETNDDVNYIKILRYVAIGYNKEVD